MKAVRLDKQRREVNHMQEELKPPYQIKSNPRRRVYVTGSRRKKAAGPSPIEQAANVMAAVVSSGCSLAMVYLVARVAGII